MTASTLKEGRRLYQLGFGTIWLKPRSKQPAESGWTTGPREDWKAFEKKYVPDANIGVRTGEASKIGNNYLACIDVDVKDPKYREVALEKLRSITGGKKFPTVLSGSGNGSRHLYCVTPQPFKMVTVAKEKDAWEICVYSSGRQMVLPPSVHPDTGKPYAWALPVVEEKDLPVMTFDEYESVKGPSKKKSASPRGRALDEFTFKAEDVFIETLPLKESMKRAIIDGEGVTDRSAFLLPACLAMVNAKMSQDAILSVLTDETTYLGKCAYDHAKTSDRERAAYWVWRFTLTKIQAERNAGAVFEGVPLEAGRKLTKEEIFVEEEKLSQENGFYTLGPRGGSVPQYDALLKHFDKKHPFRTIADMRSVYAFNGTHFVHMSPIEVKAFAERALTPKPDERIRNEFLSKVLANNISSRRFFSDTIEGKINFKNGILDLNATRGGTLLKHSPEYGFRGVLPYEYDAEADCPVFREWIDGVMLGNGKLIAILQEYMGYIVRGGEYKHHKALWLEGEGRNGKSTFVDLLKALIGPENFSTLSIKSLVGDKFASADLEGKIANFSEETSPAELKDSGPFKNLTGDGDVSAQKKYGDLFHFRNRAKLIMTYNRIPDLTDLSPGMLSRPIIVPFRKVIKDGEQDKGIKRKLLAELPGIFNFALEGWYRLEKMNSFTTSKQSSLALTKVKEESCNVYQWVETYVKFLPVDSDVFVSAAILLEAYKKAERYPYRNSEFFRRLKKHPEMQKRYHPKTSARGYMGISLIGFR